MNEISSALQKLLRYFNTIISISFMQSFSVCPVICCLKLSEILLLSVVKSIILPLLRGAGSSL